MTTAGIRRTKASVPPPKRQTSGPGKSRALPNPRANVPQKTKAIWGRRFSVDAGPFGTIGCPSASASSTSCMNFFECGLQQPRPEVAKPESSLRGLRRKFHIRPSLSRRGDPLIATTPEERRQELLTNPTGRERDDFILSAYAPFGGILA